MTFRQLDGLTYLPYHVDVSLVKVGRYGGDYLLPPMLVDGASVHQPRQLFGTRLAFGDLVDDALVTLPFDLGDEVAETEAAPLHHGVKLVGVVHQVFILVEYATAVLAHVLNHRVGHETAAYQVLLHALGYPLRVLHVALAVGELLDEIRVDQLERHVVEKFVPHGNPINRRALHGALLHTAFDHVLAHLPKVCRQRTVSFFKNNGLVIAHNTKINRIFVDVKASHDSVSVHNIEV